MTIRNDLTFEPELSPRLVTLAKTSNSISIQDLHDSITNWEDDAGLSFDKLIDSAGKEDLGGGVNVGITSTLQNTLLEFEPRTTPSSTGTATSTGTSILIDISATFQTNLIKRGDIIINFSDKSIGTVVNVTSETTIEHTILSGGTNNFWTITDSYNIYPIVQVNVSGGNLVAIDNNGISINTILPSFGTQVVRTSSSSATIAALEIEQLKFLIESRRPHHSGFGNMFFVDPVNGIDTNEGNSALKAFKTLTKAIAATTNFNNDVISLFPGNSAGQTILDENVIINKNDVYIRGPGRGFMIKPTLPGSPTIQITGSGVEISSVVVGTATGGSDNAIEVNSNFAEIRNIWIEGVTNSGIHIMESTNTRIVKSTIKNCTNDGITISNNTSDIDISNSTISNNASDAVHIVGTGIKNVKFGVGSKLFGNVGYGINIGTGVINTVLTTDLTIFDNALGEINDLSNTTGFGGRVTEQNYGEVVHINSIGVSGTIFPRGTSSLPSNNLTDARNIANRVGIIAYKFHNNLTLNIDHIDWEFIGASKFPSIDIGGFNVDGSKFKFTTITGNCSGSITTMESTINNLTNANGLFVDTLFKGTTFIANNAIMVMHKCISGQTTPMLDFSNVTTGATVDIRTYSGELSVQNFTKITDTLILDIIGKFTLDSTNTNGNIILRGIGEFVNNSSIPIANINTTSFINNITTDAIKKDTSLIPGLI